MPLFEYCFNEKTHEFLADYQCLICFPPSLHTFLKGNDYRFFFSLSPQGLP